MTGRTEISRARGVLTAGRSIAPLDLPDEIAGSWRRCRKLGLDPSGLPLNAVVSHQELLALRQAKGRLLEIVRPELELLSSQVAGTNFLCAFADENGVVLDAIMDTEFSQGDCARSVRAGSVWREEIRGTNALGLAMHTGQASMVTGGEHYFDCHGNVSCVSVPIFDSRGEIAGLLDASSEVAARQMHTAALVNLSAANIENRLLAETHGADYVIQFHPRAEYLATQSVALIAVDEAGRITGTNRVSSRFLSSTDFSGTQCFGDLFRGAFHDLLQDLIRGETVRLSCWSGSVVFARLLPGLPRRTGARVQALGAAGSRRAGPRATAEARPVVNDDGLARECLRVARKAAGLGLAVCLRGAKGCGKTTMARTLHDQSRPGKPMIVLDCRRIAMNADVSEVHAAMTEKLSQAGDATEGATLLFENIDALDAQAGVQLDLVLETLPGTMTGTDWTVLATCLTEAVSASDRTVTIAGFPMLAVDLPELSERTDFEKIARRILQEVSPEHQLSTRAVRALAALERPNNLSDLRHQLQVLAASCPAGVLRDSQIARFCPRKDEEERACPKCESVPIKRQRCLEIRRTFRACQSNVALTARRLGVSRNTVYAHLKD